MININNNVEPHQSLKTSDSANEERPLLRCQFDQCKDRAVWFPGFKTQKDFSAHMDLHRCQWNHWDANSRICTTCQYIPFDTKDILAHVERHCAQDLIPAYR